MRSGPTRHSLIATPASGAILTSSRSAVVLTGTKSNRLNVPGSTPYGVVALTSLQLDPCRYWTRQETGTRIVLVSSVAQWTWTVETSCSSGKAYCTHWVVPRSPDQVKAGLTAGGAKPPPRAPTPRP